MIDYGWSRNGSIGPWTSSSRSCRVTIWEEHRAGGRGLPRDQTARRRRAAQDLPACEAGQSVTPWVRANVAGDAAKIFQKNILSKHPVILGLFSGAGGRLILYQTEGEWQAPVPLRWRSRSPRPSVS